jgi:hypothetical protein
MENQDIQQLKVAKKQWLKPEIEVIDKEDIQSGSNPTYLEGTAANPKLYYS